MTGIDIAISEFLNNFTGRHFLIDGVFIFFSEYFIYILTGFFLLFIFRIKNWKERVRALFVGIIGVILSRGIMTPLIRYFFEKQRPFVALDLNQLVDHSQTGSFPSGHIAFIVPLILTLFYINKRAGIWGLICALIIGIARVGVGVHWMSDILSGFLVGSIGYFIAQALLKLKTPQREIKELPTESN